MHLLARIYYPEGYKMNMTVIHKSSDFSVGKCDSLLKFVLADEMIADITFSRLARSGIPGKKRETLIAIPRQWKTKLSPQLINFSYYGESLPVYTNGKTNAKPGEWFIISNGRFVCNIDIHKLGRMLSKLDCDLIAVNVDPQLLSYREKVRITSDGSIAGFRRLYRDTILPEPIFADWPNFLFIKTGVLEKILVDGTLPLNFTDLLSRCGDISLKCQFFRAGGIVIDLETEAGLLKFTTAMLDSASVPKYLPGSDAFEISTSARFFGEIVIGNNVRIDDDAVIDGPVIIGDNVTISKSAVVRNSIIASNLTVPIDKLISNRVILEQKIIQKPSAKNHTTNLAEVIGPNNHFRKWPLFSYARLTKRLADMIVSAAVLILFAPILPIIAVIIKLSSPGPIFFRHIRQGRCGSEFSCLKFRTMIIGANEIQEKLRSKNQVDGPQFKIDDDPRITMVGKFLRDTFIDEIPQFINILLGQMSLIGPRPSPETENSMCPVWHDARLSVRPGITGLWQMCRTRQTGRDFQEWIHYDTKYVKNLSLKTDLIIFWQTIKKLTMNFVSQF